MEDPDNQEYITLECVGDDGDVIPNMLVLSAKQHLEEFLRRMIWRTVCPLLSAIRVTSMMKLGYNGLKSLMSALEEKGKEHARCYSWTELAVILTKNLWESVTAKTYYHFNYRLIHYSIYFIKLFWLLICMWLK